MAPKLTAIGLFGSDPSTSEVPPFTVVGPVKVGLLPPSDSTLEPLLTRFPAPLRVDPLSNVNAVVPSKSRVVPDSIVKAASVSVPPPSS